MRTRITWVAEDDGTRKGYIGPDANILVFTLRPQKVEGYTRFAIQADLPGYRDERGPEDLDQAKLICEGILVNFAVYTMNWFKEVL
jgi:hypothetical protein